MFEKGQELEILIEDISDQGQGIGHVDGFTVFVNGTMPGDKAVVSLTKVKKRYAFANVMSILEPSPNRVESLCPYAEECGGCTFMGYDYDAELELKARQIKDKLERLGGVNDPLVRDIVGMQQPWRYRNKAVFQVSVSSEKGEKPQVCVGFNRVRTHDVVDCKDCILQTPGAVAAAEALRVYLREYSYCKAIKNMTVKTAFGTGEVMVIIGSDGGEIPKIEELVELMDDAVYQAGYSLESFYVDTGFGGKSGGKGSGKGALRSGSALKSGSVSKAASKKEPELIAGSKVINEEIGGLKFEISPWSFYQVNPVMMEALYDKVAEYAGNNDSSSDKKTLLDLYCGVGSIGLWCLKNFNGTESQGREMNSDDDQGGAYDDSYDRGAFVLGIETEHQAVLDANRNAVINGIVNARYICGKAEEVMPELVKPGAVKGDRDDRDDRDDGKEIGDRDDGKEIGDRDHGEETDGRVEILKETANLKYDEALYATAENTAIAILDPPRSGCHEALLDSLASVAPEIIVYVSCDPATLARDIKKLTVAGYRFVEATPVDMFPRTGHVETVVLLSHQKSTEYINEQHPEKNDHT